MSDWVDWTAIAERAKMYVPANNRAEAMREILSDIAERYAGEWTENERAAFFAVGCFLRLCMDIESAQPSIFAPQY